MYIPAGRPERSYIPGLPIVVFLTCFPARSIRVISNQFVISSVIRCTEITPVVGFGKSKC